MEVLGRSRRQRRFLFLAQEATGLCRPSEWCMAAGVWLVVLVWAHFLVGEEAGAGTHLLVTFAPMAALMVWAVARHIRLDRWRLLWVFGSYAMPVGHLELFFTRTLLLSVAFFLTGLLSAMGVAAICPGKRGAAPAWVAAASANLVQFWIVFVAVGALISAQMLRRKRSLAPAAFLSIPLFMAFACALLGAVDQLFEAEGAASVSLLTSGAYASIAMVWAAYGGWPVALYMRDPAFRDLLLAGQLEALVWVLVVAPMCFSLALLWQAARGRAHERYRSGFAVGRPPARFLSPGSAP